MLALPLSASSSLSGYTTAQRIELWLALLLLQLPMKEQLREQHMKTKLGLTEDGSNFLNQLASPMTHSSTDWTDANKTSSSVPLQQQSEKEDFQGILLKPWLLEQSEVPFQVYAWSFGSMDNPIHSKTETFNLASFYNNNRDPLSTMTPNRNNKKPSLSGSLPILQNKRTQIYNKLLDSFTTPAVFFAMQSWEYLKVTQAKKRQTDNLCLCTLHFSRTAY
jgi:hypothetical protein